MGNCANLTAKDASPAQTPVNESRAESDNADEEDMPYQSSNHPESRSLLHK